MQGNINQTLVSTVDSTADPGPLGLLGFGMTTVLLNLHNAGLFALDSMIMAMGIFYGGIAQIIAGVMEWKKGNTFGATAFISYGSFWLTLVGLLVIPEQAWGVAADSVAMGAYLFMWGLFTAGMFIGTLKINRNLQVIFGTLVILFWLLAIGNWTGNTSITQIAGYVGIICGFSAFYTALSQVIAGLYSNS